MLKYEDVLKYWQSQSITTSEDYRTILDNFKILFAFNSNKIENEETTYHNTREIFENGKVINYTGDLRTLFEIQNQKECYEFLIDKMVSKEPISKELILKVHSILCKGCYDETRFAKGERPGSFKKNDYGVGDDVGAAPEEVEDAIEELCKELRENEGADPIVVASYFHLVFESIHPFADGNGRVGRTMMNYYLTTHNYPPTIIYDEDKKYYYMALTIYDKSEQIKGFVSFIKDESVKTWSNKCDRSLMDDNSISRINRKSIRETVREIKNEMGSFGDDAGADSSTGVGAGAGADD